MSYQYEIHAYFVKVSSQGFSHTPGYAFRRPGRLRRYSYVDVKKTQRQNASVQSYAQCIRRFGDESASGLFYTECVMRCIPVHINGHYVPGHVNGCSIQEHVNIVSLHVPLFTSTRAASLQKSMALRHNVLPSGRLHTSKDACITCAGPTHSHGFAARDAPSVKTPCCCCFSRC